MGMAMSRMACEVRKHEYSPAFDDLLGAKPVRLVSTLGDRVGAALRGQDKVRHALTRVAQPRPTEADGLGEDPQRFKTHRLIPVCRIGHQAAGFVVAPGLGAGKWKELIDIDHGRLFIMVRVPWLVKGAALRVKRASRPGHGAVCHLSLHLSGCPFANPFNNQALHSPAHACPTRLPPR